CRRAVESWALPSPREYGAREARGATIPRMTRSETTAEPADASAHSNRLAGETSPYLLQHAHNPVDWYPWGPAALAAAKAADKPIFLSIGYAACHWCHVMERERPIPGSGERALSGEAVLEAAVAALEETFDARRGGWGGAPRFPAAMTIEFLLGRAVGPDGRIPAGGASDERALAMARRTLD